MLDLKALRFKALENKKSLFLDVKCDYWKQFSMCFQLQTTSNRLETWRSWMSTFQTHREHNYLKLVVNDCIIIFLQDICTDDRVAKERWGLFMESGSTLLIAFIQRKCLRPCFWQRFIKGCLYNKHLIFMSDVYFHFIEFNLLTVFYTVWSALG